MSTNNPQVAAQEARHEEAGIRRVNEFFVRLAKQYLPGPYILAIILTGFTFVMALVLTDRPFTSLFEDWYKGIFDLFVYILQALLVAVTGFAFAQAPWVGGLLDRVASIPKTQAQAGVRVMRTTAVASLLSWGLGLVTTGLMARQIVKQMPVNYGYLVAAAYGGFMVWASGASSTIALAIATPGSLMNVTEQETGSVTPLTESILTWWNIAPVVLILISLSLYYYKVAPRGGLLSEEDRRKLAEEDEVPEEDGEEPDETPARRMENSPLFLLVLAALVVGYFAVSWSSSGFTFGLNELIMIFFLLGWLAHRRPIRYIHAFQSSIRAGGPIALQFPHQAMTAMGVAYGEQVANMLQPFWCFPFSPSCVWGSVRLWDTKCWR